jgi:3-methylcrotonyl-CoA carboxylase alpha subunit
MADEATLIEASPGELLVERDGRRRRLFVAVDGPTRWVFYQGRTYLLEQVDAAGSESSKGRTGFRGSKVHAASALSAPMPATVLRIQTTPGSVVKKGDTLLVLEAMKMELPLRAPQDGVVSAVHCAEGQLVQPGVTLVDFGGE